MVYDDAVVWIAGDTIAAVQDADQPAPPKFEDIDPLDTGGTIYPGFIDLHNHLAYNVLPLWPVPAPYTNRDRWKDEPTYDQRVKRPMSVLRDHPETLPAICRYVECKALFGGTTTTQGIRLARANKLSSYYRGIVRNVEMPDDRRLPRGESRMADVAAKDVHKFVQTLERFDGAHAAYLLHLSEGWDDAAHAHFLALDLGDGEWAIDRALAGIHCVGLHGPDFEILRAHEGSMVWSPFSNLLLYGQTANLEAARAAKLRIALGCDWSPSGSKNLLAELKVASLVARQHDGLFSDRELVAMVTSGAAEILRWSDRLGTVEAGKLADLTVLANLDADPYRNVLVATERDVRLVAIGGVPRYGTLALMHALVPASRDVETTLIAGQPRMIDLASADPRVPKIRFTEAQAILCDALDRLPELERARTPAYRAAGPAAGWTLALDETESTGLTQRALAPTTATPPIARAAARLPTIAMTLDPPTVVDDPGFCDAIAREPNLPGYVIDGLTELYAPRDRAPHEPASDFRHTTGSRIASHVPAGALDQPPGE